MLMAQKLSPINSRQHNPSPTQLDSAEHFMGSNPAQPVFPERKFSPPFSEDQTLMMRETGPFAGESKHRKKVSREGRALRTGSSPHLAYPLHRPALSRHTRNQQQNSGDCSARDAGNKTDCNYNGQNHAKTGFVVKLEPGAEHCTQAMWQSEAFRSSFWTSLPSDGFNSSRGDRRDLVPGKRDPRGHGGSSVDHGRDPVEYFRNPSWHERTLSEKDGKFLEDRGSPRQRGKPSVCEGSSSAETRIQSALSERRRAQRPWPAEKAPGTISNKEEEEEEDLFHPPVHFASHQQGQRSASDQLPQSPLWEEEEMGEEDNAALCEEGDLPQFPISTFRARLDETKCHKRKATVPGNAVAPSTTSEQVHECPHCVATFVDANNLKRHVSYIHSEKVGENDKARKRKRRCEECGKTFDRPSRLERHKVVHSGEKPFVCDICNKAFSRASNLKIHQNLHTGRKPFVCDLCDKAFSDGGKLKKHQVIHTGDKPFVCDICHKGFAETGNLKRHKKYHIGHKAFACDVCGKAFIESGMLRRHKVQTNHNPIICFVCNRTFLLPEHLEEHAKVHSLQGDATDSVEEVGSAS